jgi:hypothetical protein
MCEQRLRERLRIGGLGAGDIDRFIERASIYDREQSEIESIARVFLLNDGSMAMLAREVDDAIKANTGHV